MSDILSRLSFKPSRKRLFLYLGIFSLLVYAVLCIDYFEERDSAGLSKGISIYPLYEHMEIYSYGEAQFPLGIETIKLTKTPFISVTYCQNSENTSIVKYYNFSKKLSAEVYFTSNGERISTGETSSFPLTYAYSKFFSPLLRSENTATTIRLHTKLGKYDICALNMETLESVQ